MREVELTDGAIVYITDYGNSDGKCRIYDSNKEFLNYFEENGTTEEDYENFIVRMSSLDSTGLFECFSDSYRGYDYGNSPEEIMKNYCNDVMEGCEYNQLSENLKNEVKDVLFDCFTLTDEELCREYDINKIGNLYFRGNW
jgi:hypothetical protein